MTNEKSRINAWTPALLAVASASYLTSVYRQHANTVDDAYISFRFAQHLADGYGLVWNVGGPPTEGYTNFLWVVLLASFRAVGADLETLAPLFMIGATIGTVLILLWIMKRHLGGIRALPVAVVAIYLADAFTAVHTISGLETPLAVFLVTLALGAVLDLQDRASDWLALGVAATFVLAVLTRPDMALFVGGLSVGLLSIWRQIGVRRLVISLGATAALLSMYAVWKVKYFGYLLPNPFYVKAAPGGALALAGLRPILRYFDHLQGQALPLWVPLLILMVIRPKRLAALWTAGCRLITASAIRPTVLALTVPPVLGWLYYLTIIHEVGFASRFSFPTYPFVVLCGAAIASWVADRRSILSTKMETAILILVTVTIIGRTNWSLRVEAPAFPADLHAPIAEALRKTGLGAQISVHFSAAGRIPYLSGVNHVDPVGLVDNDLCGRARLTRESYEQILWSRPADVYLSAEPPATAGAHGPADDPVMRTAYMTHLLGDTASAYALAWRHPRFGSTTRLEREVFLHRRMRLLRDEWIWLGEHRSEALWNRLHFKLMVYVRKDSPFRDQLVSALRPVADVSAGNVDLANIVPRAK